MKKQYSETPLCEAHAWAFENTLLTGSDFGNTGEPGSSLDELPGINGAPVIPDIDILF